jgi:S-adenosylmethionine:tRNA ribosyltransferase-isomerase
VLVSDFNYHLPKELIVQEPSKERAASRLLRLGRSSGQCADRRFSEFPDLLRPDDLVVFNNTRVFPARLYGRRARAEVGPMQAANQGDAPNFSSGKVEVLLSRQISSEGNEWDCLVRPGRKIGPGERLWFGEAGELEAELVAPTPSGGARLRFSSRGDFFETLERIGHVPLPPYITRSDRPEDRERYQTVYAREPGAVAAPTAGLHFTPEVLEAIKQRGIETVEITLHVGLGTFQPIRVERVEDHRMHSEFYSISAPVAAAINRAVERRRRVVAVGTTTVRTLEFSSRQSGTGTVRAGSGETDIFIYPGYEFRVVGAMLTNFHLPRSTLLMLVCAFAGRPAVLRAYEHAVRQKYGFFSYGDCMFVE